MKILRPYNKINAAFNSYLPERQLNPDDYDEPRHRSTQGNVEFEVDTQIIVDGDFIAIPDDQSLDFLNDVLYNGDKSYVEVETGYDMSSEFGTIEYDIDHLIEDLTSVASQYLPLTDGVYHLTGFANLVYDISDIEDYGDDIIDMDSIEIKLNFGSSNITDVNCEYITSDIPEGY